MNAHIVEIITKDKAVAEQKEDIIANVFSEMSQRTDAKIFVRDITYGFIEANPHWLPKTENAPGSNTCLVYVGEYIDFCGVTYFLIYTVEIPCSHSSPGDGRAILQDFAYSNKCGGSGGGGGSGLNPPYTPPSGNTGPGTGGGVPPQDWGQDLPLSANFTPAHIEDPEGIYKQYKTTILEYMPIISAFISNPPANAPAGMVDYMKLKLAALNKAKADMETIEKSKHKYFFKSIPIVNNKADGETSYDVANNRVVVEFPANPPQGIALVLGVKAHEMHHAGQFERGQISFNKTTGKGGVLVDLKDEVASYEIQYLIHTNFFNYGKIDLEDKPSPNFVVNSTTVLALGIYNALPTKEINIYTDPQGTTLQNATNPTDIFVKP